jgi:hypothetical protein
VNSDGKKRPAVAVPPTLAGVATDLLYGSPMAGHLTMHYCRLTDQGRIGSRVKKTEVGEKHVYWISRKFFGFVVFLSDKNLEKKSSIYTQNNLHCFQTT